MGARYHWSTAVMLLALATCAGASSVSAQQARPANLMVCAGCHSPEPGTLPAAEAERIPRLGGQQPDYLREALEAYRTRQRDHFYMRGMAAGLRGSELDAAIAYLAAPASGATATPARATPPAAAAAARCIACHGTGAQQPATPQTPRLDGQHARYIEAAFLAYASGFRKHALMSPQARSTEGSPTLSPGELREVAAWFSRRPGLVAR